jgi:hypothetical protein
MSSSRARSAPSTPLTPKRRRLEAWWLSIHSWMAMGVCLVLWLFGLWLDMDGARSCVSSPSLGSVHAYQGASNYIQSIRAGRTCPCSEQSPDTLQKCEARCCSGCHREESGGEKFLSCSRCSIVRYCSRRCQKRDWKRHKLLCHEAGGI